jgi:hypothetical protein
VFPFRFLLVAFALVTLIFSARRAAATDFLIFPLKVSLPVQIVSGGQVTKRTLKEHDIVNLALGRPLGTKVDKKTEVLAVASSYDGNDGTVVVFDPSQNGLAQLTTTVAEPTTVDVENAFLNSGRAGVGTVTGTVEATTLGTPALHGLLASTLWGSGAGKSSFAGKASVTGAIGGRLSFTVTENGQTTTLTGFIVKGKGKVGGAPITIFDDGNDPPVCGDGIVQPGIGEECEFNQQAACPGKCNACTCWVCGNARIDPGEICDGATLGVCAQLMVPCQSNCSGCQF